jgi:chloramphenicol 3-O phosphotransferase
VPTQIIVLNGGSSSGKSAIADELQTILPEPWLRLGVDELLDALPPSFTETDTADGIAFGPDGEVTVGASFRRAEHAWLAGIAVMARTGVKVIVEDAFLDGAESQQRLRAHFEGLDVLWVGVRCAPDAAAARESARKDRVHGMAERQAEAAHAGVAYTLEVDTTGASAKECAGLIATHVDQAE